MKTKFTVTLALAAGFVGGVVSRYVVAGPALAYAQTSGPTPENAAQIIRAHKFILVDETGMARGVFGIEKNGAPAIEIADDEHVFHSVFQPLFLHGIGRVPAPAVPKPLTLLPVKP